MMVAAMVLVVMFFIASLCFMALFLGIRASRTASCGWQSGMGDGRDDTDCCWNSLPLLLPATIQGDE